MKVTRGSKIRVGKYSKPYKVKDSFVLIVDLDSKRTDVFGTGSENGVPQVVLTCTEETLYTKKKGNELLELSFPEYKGYSIFTATVAKYTLSLGFAKFE